MRMGAREFLFLWSECVLQGWDWPTHLETSRYDPHRDVVTVYWKTRMMHLKVSREGSASCDILKKHGLTQDQIDAAVKSYLEEV